MPLDNGALGRSPVVRVAGDVASDGAERIAASAREETESIPVVRTGPTGATGMEPLVLATRGGETAYFVDPDRSTVRSLLDALERGTVPTEGADTVVQHDPETGSLPVPGAGPLSAGRRATLAPCGWVDPLSPGDYSLIGEGDGERDARDAVEERGLSGRGRGDASDGRPVAEAWATAEATAGEPVVVVNANETRPEQQVDRTLLSGAPLAVLEGAAAVADRVGTEDVVVYLNGNDRSLQRHLREAVDASAGAVPVTPQLVAGPDEYHAGAPTTALEAMEGADRVEPRIQPPSPAEYGLYGRPTVVHTPRTFAHVQRAVSEPNPSEAETADPGTRLFTVSGAGTPTTTVEVPSGESLGTVIEAVDGTNTARMACVGGVFGGFTRDFDVPLSARSLNAANLGTDGVVELFDETRCPVAEAGKRAKFAATENSGRCVPGREGTKQLTELVRDVYRGSFETDRIRELARVMRRSSNCRTGAHSPRPVVTALDEFEPAFRAHADGRCPSGACTEEL